MMMTGKKIFSVVCLWLALSCALPAQSIRVESDALVRTGENFNVTFVFENCTPSDFSWDGGEDFQIVWGPQKGFSSSSSNINGKKTSSTSVTYGFVLVALRDGELTIPSATAMVDGKQVSSAPKKIEALGGSSSGSAQNRGNSSSSSSYSEKREQAGPELYLQYVLSKSSVVLGEPVTISLYLYKKGALNSFDEAKFSRFNGFWSQEDKAPSDIQFSKAKFRSDIYDSALIRSYTLIPQQTGDLSIDPAEITCSFLVRSNRAPSNPFEAMMDDGYSRVVKTASTAPVAIHVKALPSGAPDSFSGGVGSFTMDVRLSRDTLTAHEAASLTVSLSGRGNVSMLDAPKIMFPSDFDVYDTKIEDKSSRMSGVKTFEFPFIPRSHGEFDIPSVKYSYYDTSSGAYVTLTSDPLHISVGRSSKSDSAPSSGQIVSMVVPRDVKSLGEDIDYIETGKMRLTSKGSFFVFSPLFFIILAVLILVCAGVFFALKRRAARQADVVGQKRRKATKMARKRLSAAKAHLAAGDSSLFYEELHKALLGFASDKLTMEMSAMSKDSIKENLQGGGVDGQTAGRFIDLVDECEFARYSSGGTFEQKESHYESALELISMIGDSYRKPSSAGKAVSLVLVALLCLPASLSAAQASEEALWRSGCQAYNDGDWTEAINNWKAIEVRGMESASLYTNIADAYFRLGRTPEAILYYERALKVDSSYDPAIRNLQVISPLLLDKIDEVPSGALSGALRSFVRVMSSDAWAWLSIFLFALTLSLVLMFLLGGSPGRRKLGFFGALVALLLSLSALGFSLWRMNDYKNRDRAVVMRPVVTVKSMPGEMESSKDKFVLHEGTRVKVLREEDGWMRIEIADGRDGWMPCSSAERI